MTLVLLLMLGIGAAPVAAAVDLPGSLAADAAEEALPESAREYLEGMDAEHLDAPGALERIAETAQRQLWAHLREALSLVGVILAVVLICALTAAAEPGGRSTEYVLLAGVAAIGSAAVSDVQSFLALGTETLSALVDYSHVLLPLLSSTAAAAGAVGTAAARCAATALFMDILLSLSQRLVLPCVCGYAALALANAALGGGALKAAGRLMKEVCTLLLTGLTIVFTLWLTVVSAVTGGADAVTTRLTKSVVSSALPVVGRIVSDAAGTLAAAASSLRALVGSFGLLAVLCTCLTPFIRLGVRYLAYKLTSALCACLADSRLSELLDSMGSCFGMLLSMTGMGGLFMFLSIFSFLQIAL